jgi:hypothetical protein
MAGFRVLYRWGEAEGACLMTEDEPPSESSGKGHSQTTAFLATLVQVSALVTAFAALIYVLGIVALWMPIARAFTNDFSTALYAVSLMSRTVVAGQGVRSLFGPALVITLYLLLYYLLMAVQLELYIRAFDRKPRKWLRRFFNLWLLVVGSLAIGGVLEPYVFPPSSGPASVPGSENLVLALQIASFALYLFGLTVLTVAYKFREGNWGWGTFGREYEKGSLISSSWWRKKVLPYVVLFSLFVVLSSFPLAAAQDPPLPQIRVDGTSKTEGYLLVHSDGFWYLFDKEGDLLAIPDSEVKTVRIAWDLPSV